MSVADARLFLFLDSSARDRWRPSLVEAISASDHELVESGVPATFEPEGKVAILSDDINWTVLIAPANIIVLFDGTVETLADHQLPQKLAFHAASGRLAMGTYCISADAIGVGRGDTDVVLPKIGRVTAKPAAPQRAVRSPLEMYATLPPTTGVTTFWEPELFYYPVGAASDGGQPAIDLTGRARSVVHGPYIYLTPGRWRARVEFEVDPEGGQAHLRFQWGSVVATSTTLISAITVAGAYVVELEHSFESISPAQVIISTEQPLFQGRLELKQCHITLIRLI